MERVHNQAAGLVPDRAVSYSYKAARDSGEVRITVLPDF
jgi:hypothetical protein